MVMKKTFKSLLVIIAVMVAFAGCQKEEVNAPAAETKTVQFFAESIETKTAFGTPDGTTYPTLWSEGDKVKILVNLESVKNTEKTVTVDCSEDFKSASFAVELAQPEATTYTYYSISPSVALLGKTAEKLYVQIPTEQNPLETSVDKAAQLLYASSETEETMSMSVKLFYHHMTAYGKLSLANLTSNISSISSVKIEAPEDVYLAGKWDYFVADGSFVVRNGNGSNTITLTTSNTTDIWFACAPADMSERKMTLTVTTDKGDLKKEITFPANRKFEAGRIAKFTVDMAGIEVEKEDVTTEAWTLVTNAGDLVVGDKVIIAAKESNYAISTTQNSNNRGQTSITKTGNTLSAPSTSVQILTLTEGTVQGTFGFYTGSQYLYAASSSSNYLRSQDTNNANGSWKVDISTDGTANIQAQGANTRNVMQYNQSNSLFACYASASQKALVIYKLVSTGTGGETPVEKTLESIAVSDDVKTEYTVGDEFVEPTVTATYSDGSTEDVTASAEFTGYNMSAADTYTVTVSYSGKTVTYNITVSAAQDGGDVTGPVTVTTTIGGLGWTNETKYTTIVIDDVITATASGEGNTGKYYTSGNDWRLYQSESATLSITAKDGYTIKTVKFTYTISKTGILMKGATQIKSDTVDTVNATSVTYSVGNTSASTTNGQVRITAIEVVYQAN